MVTFFENFILGVALTLPLGPVTLEILRRGIKFGYLQSIKTAIGAFSAELTYFTLIYFGLSKFSESFIVKYILGFLGVGFLLYLGYENFKDFKSNKDFFSTKILNKNNFLSGYLITFLNPINLFMWVGIIGSFFTMNTSLLISSGVLYGIFISLLLMTCLSFIGKKLIKKNKMKYVSLSAGIFLIYYGLKLLYNLFSS